MMAEATGPSGPEPAGPVTSVTHNKVMSDNTYTITNYDEKCKHGYYIHLPLGKKAPCGCYEWPECEEEWLTHEPESYYLGEDE